MRMSWACWCSPDGHATPSRARKRVDNRILHPQSDELKAGQWRMDGVHLHAGSSLRAGETDAQSILRASRQILPRAGTALGELKPFASRLAMRLQADAVFSVNGPLGPGRRHR